MYSFKIFCRCSCCCRFHGTFHKNKVQNKASTRMGFEPTRAEHIGLAVQRLNHSATSSGENIPVKLLYSNGLAKQKNSVEKANVWPVIVLCPRCKGLGIKSSHRKEGSVHYMEPLAFQTNICDFIFLLSNITFKSSVLLREK